MTTPRIEEIKNWREELRKRFPPSGKEDGAYLASLSQVGAFIELLLTQAHQAGIRDAVVIVESKRLNGSEDGSKFGHYGWEAYNQALDDTIKALTDNKKEYDQNLPPTIQFKTSQRPAS